MKEASDLHISMSVVQLPWITVKVAYTFGVFWLVLGFFLLLFSLGLGFFFCAGVGEGV